METQTQSPNDKTFAAQFSLAPDHYVKHTDFLNWFRYFYLIRKVFELKPKSVLEAGVGDGLVRNCLKPHVSEYTVLDINEQLKPDVLGDLRIPVEKFKDRFDCAIAADILEHIPFSDLTRCLSNLRSYLVSGGHCLITIPHRRSNFLFMSPTAIPHVFTVPTGFLSPGSFYRRFIKRKIWIDPHHCWEIGDGHIKRRDVERCIAEAGFKKVSFKKLLYVDFWVLRRE